MDALLGEANAALLAFAASRLAVSMSWLPVMIEGDSLLTIIALNDHLLFLDWTSVLVISDIQVQLLSINVWSALKTFRCANVDAHFVGKWAVSHLVFESFYTISPFILSIRLKSGNDYPLVICNPPFPFFFFFFLIWIEKKKRKRDGTTLQAYLMVNEHVYLKN